VYKTAPYIPGFEYNHHDSFVEEDAKTLQALGTNAIRLNVAWNGVYPEDGVIDYNYLGKTCWKMICDVYGQRD
jgi:beta-galactosidase GanA